MTDIPLKRQNGRVKSPNLGVTTTETLTETYFMTLSLDLLPVEEQRIELTALVMIITRQNKIIHVTNNHEFEDAVLLSDLLNIPQNKHFSK